ncbi:MAG: DUF4215 domain-containing protein, partial [Candidatus Pacearchaeota archaeon]
MKLFLSLTFIFTLAIFSLNFIPTISADVISINSGGSGNIALTPGGNIEGFFTGSAVAAICGDGVIDTGVGEQCDDGNVVSGDGCSSTCQTEAAPPSEDGGGGDGGDVSGANIKVIPSWNATQGINLAVNTTKDETITVTNLGTSQVIVTLTHNFGDHLQILGGNITLTIPAGESRTFNIRFIAGAETGIVLGIITISSQSVFTSLDISTVLLLFDSNIIVLNKDYIVIKGEDLRTRVTLIPLG